MSGGGNSQGSGDGFQSQGSECLDAIMAESPVGDAAPAPSMLPQPRPAPIPDLATPVLDGASPTAPSDHASSGANTSAAASASIEAAGVGGDGGGGGGVAVGPSSNKRKQREDPGESCSAAGCGGATASSSAAAAKKVPHRPRRRRVYTRKKRTQTSRDASPRTGKKAGRPGTACAFHSKKKDKCPQSRGKLYVDMRAWSTMCLCL